MNFIVNNQENSQNIYLSTVLIQEISAISVENMPTFHVFRKVHTAMPSNFSTFLHLVSRVLSIKGYSLYSSARKYLHTPFYSLDVVFTLKRDSNTIYEVIMVFLL